MNNDRLDIHSDISKEYAQIRLSNKLIQQKRIDEIYKQIPRIKEIDEEINKLALGFASEVLEGELSPQRIIGHMQAQMNMLTDEKRRLLISKNYPQNIMEEVYTCTRCNDKGHFDGRRCNCYIQKRNKLLQKYSNISMSDKNSFRSFNVNLFSTVRDEKYGVSPRENMESVYKIALSFADGEKDSPKNLMFYGATGLGKTFTTDCIAKRYIENGKTVFYMSAPKMFSIFEDYKFGRDTSAEMQSAISSIYNSELLIIDDLGTEFKTTYSDSILFDVINSRIIKETPIIISTNLSIKDLKHAYSERIYSRILGNFNVVLFFGEDLRLKSL